MANNYQSQVDAAKSALDTIIVKTRELDVELLKVVASLNKVNSLKTPSDISNGLKAQGDEIKKLNDLLAKQQEQITKLIAAKSNLNQKTSDEIINQIALAKQSDLQAKAQSKLVGAYQNLVAKQQQAKKVLQDLVVVQGKNSLATKQAQKEYDKLTAKVNLANKATSNFSNSGLGKLALGFKNLLGAFGLVGGAMLFADFAKSVINTIKELDKLDFTLKAVITNEGELARTRAFLTEISLKYGAEIVATTERYTKFMVAARQSGVALKEIEAIFGTVTKASAVLGLKTDELNGIYLALEQMFSKGKVTTEELRRQLGERLPGAFGIMAKALGVTTVELDKMLRKGEVLSKDALPKFRVALEEALGLEAIDKVETLQTATAKLSNAWTLFVDSINKTTGIGKTWQSILENLAEGMNTLSSAFGGNITKSDQESFAEYSKTLQDTDRGTENYLDTIQKLRQEQSQLETQNINAKKQLEDLRVPLFGLISDYEKEKLALEKTIGATNGKYKAIESYIELLKNKTKQENIDKDALINSIALLDESLDLAKLEKMSIEELIALKSKLSDEEEKGNKAKQKSVEYLKGSLNYLEAQVKRFQDEQKNLAINSREWIKRQEVIDNATKALNDFNIAIDGVSTLKPDTDTDKASESSINILKDIYGKIENLDTSGAEEGFDKLSEKIKKAKDESVEAYNELLKFREGFATEFFSETGFEFTGDVLMNFDKVTKMLEEGGDQWEDYFNLITEMGQEAFNFIAQASQQNFDMEYERLEKQKEIALQFAGESDAAKQRIEEQYEARRKVIQARQAKAQKEQAIVNTTINTAQAIMQIWAHSPDPTGISQGLMTAIIAGIGAAQVAIIASQKIPEFWRGTDNASEGLAWTQEKGAEIITDKKGNIKDLGDNKGARLTKMEAGDKVYTAEKTKRLFNNELSAIMTNNDILPYSEFMGIPNVVVQDKGIKASEMDAIMGRHFSKIHTNVTNIDKKGLSTYIKNQSGKTELLNNEVTFKGLSV